MHELSIALSLIELASEEARMAGAERVTRVFLKVGSLSGVVSGALAFSFDVAAENTMLEGAVLEVEAVPATIFCPQCHAEKELADLFAFACPDCGTFTSDVRQGRELELTAIEIP